MRQITLAALILSVCVYLPAQTTPTPKRVTGQELTEVVAAGHNMPDADLAQKLSGLALTERISGARLADLTDKLPGEKSRRALMMIADQSIFLLPPAGEVRADAAPNAASARQMLLKMVNYVNATVRQLPNLMAQRFSNGFEDQPREEEGSSFGLESTFHLPLHWVGSLKMEVTYRDRQETEYKSVKVEKRGNGVGGLITAGEFGPVLTTVLGDAVKGKIFWTRWEAGQDGKLAVFHYQVPENVSRYHVKFCCFESYTSDGSTTMEVADERSAYHGDIIFSPLDGSIRLLTIEADVSGGSVVSGAGMAIEYAATDIGGRSYICPVRSVSVLRTHTAQQFDPLTGAKHKTPVKTFLNDVRFSNYRRFGSETKVLTN